MPPSILSILSLSFSDPPPTDIYTLSLHDALPIFPCEENLAEVALVLEDDVDDGMSGVRQLAQTRGLGHCVCRAAQSHADEETIRSEEHTSELHHSQISYAVFCLKKKTQKKPPKCP